MRISKRRFEKHFDGDVAYLSKKCVWTEKVARRMSEKYDLKVDF